MGMKQRIITLYRSLRLALREHPVLFVLRALVLAGVSTFFVTKRNFWTPDTLFVALLAVAVVFGQARQFVIRFLPIVVLLLAYDSLRGFADDLNSFVHYTEMIHFDTWLFGGTLPTAALQQWLWHGSVQWYDFYFYFLYTIHFAMPVLFAVLLWKKRDHLYWPFVCGLIVLSFSAYLTYIIFPAAPPWLASDNGYIQPIHRISSDIWYAMGVTNFSEVYAKLSPNLVAAVPSLHAAYPMFFLLYAARAFGWRRVWWLAIYPASLWLGIVYLGEHYVFDALLGILYAVSAYHASVQFFAWKARRGWRVKRWLQAQGRRAWAMVRARPEMDRE